MWSWRGGAQGRPTSWMARHASSFASSSAADVPPAFRHKLLDGVQVAADVRSSLKLRVEALLPLVPHLAIVFVGHRPDSATYVSTKVNRAKEIGIKTTVVRHGADADPAEVFDSVQKLNESPDVHGVIVQCPLPPKLREWEERLLSFVSRTKDVDGFHPHNVGLLATSSDLPRFASCTATGVMTLLRASNIHVAGKHVVVLGRSNVVGRPLSLLLSEADATVTLCHSKTKNVQEHARRADVLISAMGQPLLVDSRWVSKGAVVVDVGLSRVPSASATGPSLLVGDVNLVDIIEKVSFASPVPGGVGPLTVASLLEHTVIAAEDSARRQAL